jgi:hypothetical protein
MIWSIVTNWLKTSTLCPPSMRRLDELAQGDELARVFVAELARQAEEARVARGLTQRVRPARIWMWLRASPCARPRP